MGAELSFSIFDSSPPPVRKRRASSIRRKNKMDDPQEEDEDSFLSSIKKSVSNAVKIEPQKKTLLHVVTEHRKKLGMEPPTIDFDEVLRKKLEASRAKKLDPVKKLESIESSEDESSEDESGWERKKEKIRKFQISSHEDPVPWEGCQFDLSSNPGVWEKIVGNSLMGSNILRKALVFGLESGGVYACSPPLFMPTVQQAKLLAAAIYNPGLVAKDGIKISDNTFMYESGEVGSSITGISENGNVIFHLRAGKKSALAVTFNKLRRDKVMKLVEELFEYFTEVFQF